MDMQTGESARKSLSVSDLLVIWPAIVASMAGEGVASLDRPVLVRCSLSRPERKRLSEDC